MVTMVYLTVVILLRHKYCSFLWQVKSIITTVSNNHGIFHGYYPTAVILHFTCHVKLYAVFIIHAILVKHSKNSCIHLHVRSTCRTTKTVIINTVMQDTATINSLIELTHPWPICVDVIILNNSIYTAIFQYNLF